MTSFARYFHTGFDRCKHFRHRVKQYRVTDKASSQELVADMPRIGLLDYKAALHSGHSQAYLSTFEDARTKPPEPTEESRSTCRGRVTKNGDTAEEACNAGSMRLHGQTPTD
jgi:hypothetical protein